MADDASEVAFQNELRKMAGTWRLISSEKDGTEAPASEMNQSKLILAGERYILQRGGKVVEEGKFRIDPTKKPGTIDIYPTRPAGKIMMGIYEWSAKNTIKVCYTHPGTAQIRPSLFSTTEGTGHVLSVCRKEKAN
jgi:uncharacterized protein (TIGR03067 family)